MRLLLVGELNPYGPDPEFALYCEPANSAGGRLQRLSIEYWKRRCIAAEEELAELRAQLRRAKLST